MKKDILKTNTATKVGTMDNELFVLTSACQMCRRGLAILVNEVALRAMRNGEYKRQ